MDEQVLAFQLFAIVTVILGVSVVLWVIPVRLWIEAVSAGVSVGIGSLIGMRLRKVTPAAVVRPLITATKAGLDLDINALEAHYLAGGRVDRVVGALISADKASIELVFNQAAAIDLAGRDVLEAVQVSVNPKVINTPKVAAMAQRRHSAHRHRACDRACEHQPTRGRRRRGDDLGTGR